MTLDQGRNFDQVLVNPFDASVDIDIAVVSICILDYSMVVFPYYRIIMIEI